MSLPNLGLWTQIEHTRLGACAHPCDCKHESTAFQLKPAHTPTQSVEGPVIVGTDTGLLVNGLGYTCACTHLGCFEHRSGMGICAGNLRQATHPSSRMSHPTSLLHRESHQSPLPTRSSCFDDGECRRKSTSSLLERAFSDPRPDFVILGTRRCVAVWSRETQRFAGRTRFHP